MNRLLFKRIAAVMLLAFTTGIAMASVTLNSTNFPDANFRAAVASAAGVSEGGTFNEATLTTLDVSNRGITNLTGLELLTGLTTLDISGNSGLTTGASLTGLTALQRLEARNCNIRTLAGTTATGGYAGLTLGSGNSAIKYLDLSYNANFYTSGNLQYLTKLETLLLNECTNFDYWGAAAGIGMKMLKWVDVSNCKRMDRIFLPQSDQLVHLKASGTKVKGFSSNASTTATSQGNIVLKSGMTTLKYLNLADCDSLANFRAISTGYHINTLDTLILTNDTRLNGWSDGITAQTGLVYCDLGNTGQTSSSVAFTQGFTRLETLILKGNRNFGYSSSFQYLRALKYLDISNCNIYFREGGSTYFLLHYLTAANNPNLETLIVSNSQLGVNTEGLTGFSNMKTVDISGNPSMTQFWVKGSPSLTSLDLHNDAGLTVLSLNNCGMPRTNLTINDSGCTALTGLNLNENAYGSVADATSNATAWGLDNIRFLYLENNSGFSGGDLTIQASDCGSLTGLDLGNNGFTSVVAESLPASLTALMLGDNPQMTRLEMHNNPGIKTMTANPVMSDGSGLYLLGNTALTDMDISGTADQRNFFERIGNNHSLQGLPVVNLKAHHNMFYTFRNLTPVSTSSIYETWDRGTYGQTTNQSTALSKQYCSFWPASPAQPDSASLEDLTELKRLDLSYCNLKDSVYLHKNTKLTHLDVSHNRTIKRYTSSQDKGAGYRAAGGSGTNTVTSYPDYKKYLWLATTNKQYPNRQDDYDQEYYTKDYNDTTGLYILDLMHNNDLEYLDISYTGIEQTALTHCHVALARYVWVQDLPKLKYFYADYNGMRSLGVSTKNGKIYQQGLKSLERLSAIGMRGADVTTMQGSINLHGELSNNPNLHYVNLSYSDYDSIGVGLAQHLDTLIIKGNPIHYLTVQANDQIKYVDASECAFKMRGYDPETGTTTALPVTLVDRNGVTTNFNGARQGGTYNGTVMSPFSGLKQVRAYSRPALETLKLDYCNALLDVYAHHDPVLPHIDGFEHLPYAIDSVDRAFNYPTDVDSLRLVWVNDNAVFNALDLSHNNNLKYLHAYNDKALGTALGSNGMNLDPNVNLVTAWVSNSRLEAFTNGATFHLDTLKIWQNPDLTYLDVTPNRWLKWFDLHNCQISELDVSQCRQMTYFDCCNMDSTLENTNRPAWPSYENCGYTFPGRVPQNTTTPGLNSINELHFAGDSLMTVIADCNDLYCMDGLNNQWTLNKLTYSYNHINGINLSGDRRITEYNCDHNGRGWFYGELSTWRETVDGTTNDCSVHFLQLVENAGDAFPGHDTFLGHKCGQDTVRSYAPRMLIDDGFDPDKVEQFITNSSGPYAGNRTAGNAPRRASVVIGSDTVPDPDLFYGKVAILDEYGGQYGNYIEYTYKDGRTPTSLSTFYLVWKPSETPTDVNETIEDNLPELTVVSERYFDASGAEHSTTLSGVNIIVREMSDGSTQTVKVVEP